MNYVCRYIGRRLYVIRERTNHFCLKQSTINIIYLKNILKYYNWEKIIGLSMKDDNGKHRLIINISNTGNKFRTNFEPNFKQLFQ